MVVIAEGHIKLMFIDDILIQTAETLILEDILQWLYYATG